MMDMLAIQRLHPESAVPTRAHPEDAGLDLYGVEDVILPPNEGKVAKTGVAMAIPKGFVGMIADRSSLAKKGVKSAGGIIDSGYRGEVMVVLRNLTSQEIRIKAGDRIAQMLILPVALPNPVEVATLSETTRGQGGFGSTGQ